MLPTTLKSIRDLVRVQEEGAETGDPAPFFGAWGEMLPRKDNRVTINKEVKDAWAFRQLT
jgi:hypothetical protein